MEIRALPLLSTLILAGCNNTYDQDIYDTEDSDQDSAVDSGSDSGDDTDTDTDTDSDTAPPACHVADPLDKVGWTRNYAIFYEGAFGTEVHTGLGPVTTSQGFPAYAIQSQLVAGDSTGITTYFRDCGPNGEARLLETDSDLHTKVQIMPPFPLKMECDVALLRIPTLPDAYLPDLATLQTGGMWTYSYTLQIINTLDTATQTACPSFNFSVSNCTVAGIPATCIPVEGRYEAWGKFPVIAGNVTYDAFLVFDYRTEKWSESGGFGGGLFGDLFPIPGFGGSEDTEYLSKLYFVEGIGLVREETYDLADTDTPILVRDLASYTGL